MNDSVQLAVKSRQRKLFIFAFTSFLIKIKNRREVVLRWRGCRAGVLHALQSEGAYSITWFSEIERFVSGFQFDGKLTIEFWHQHFKFFIKTRIEIVSK